MSALGDLMRKRALDLFEADPDADSDAERAWTEAARMADDWLQSRILVNPADVKLLVSSSVPLPFEEQVRVDAARSALTIALIEQTGAHR